MEGGAFHSGHQRHRGTHEPAGHSGYHPAGNESGRTACKKCPRPPAAGAGPRQLWLDYLASALPQFERFPVVKTSNFIGDTLDMAATAKFEEVLLVGHVGKLVKLAAGS